MSERLVGASLLPLMIDPLHGTLYFLLAKERYHPSWPEGSGLWTDFGGRQEPGECAEAVAAREFVEESLGQVPFFEDSTLPEPMTIARALQQGHYVLQFTHLQSGTRFVTFVVHVPWDPGAPARFTKARRAQSAAHLPEKSQLGLFSSVQVLEATQCKGFLVPERERAAHHLTDALSVILPELQFHFPHLF